MSNGLNLPLRYKTKCKLCEKNVAEAASMDIPLIGNVGKRAQDLIGIAGKHLTKRHPEVFAQGLALFQEMQAFLILSAFQFEDPSIGPRLELIRATMFAQARKNTMADEMIEHIVAGFGLDPEDGAKVNAAMKALRDACCEFGQFAPKVPEEALKLVTIP